MRRKQWLGAALPFLAWAATTLGMLRAWRNDPYNPQLEGTDSYFHNREGALGSGVLFSSIDFLVLYAVLRPWSYDRSWRRALVALGLFTPSTLFNMLLLMHAGSVWATHILSVCVIWLGLVVLSAVSGITALVQWRYTREAATAG